MDHRGNATLSREFLDRDAHRTVSWTRLPDSVQPEITFMIAGHTVSNITRSGVVTCYEYDAFGRQTNVWTESANGSRTVATCTHYNAKGQIDWTEDATGNRTSYAYDYWGRRTSTTDALNQTTCTEYTGDGKVLASWGANYPVAYEYDAWGRMIAMATTRDPTYANQKLWYLLGEEMLLSDTSSPDYPPELDTTLWNYDLSTGLLTNKVYADGKGTAYAYTPDGKLATRTWARGVTTEYSYASGCNSLTNITYSDDTPDVTYAYDRLGRMTSAITAGVSTNLFEYDGLELVAETQNGIAITRATDGLGRPVGFTLGPDYEVGYGYDAYGRFQSVSSAQSADTFTYSYLPGSDLLSSKTNASGFFWSRTYEQQRNLIASVENRFGENLISLFDYANDSLARRTRRVDNLNVTNDFGYNVRSEVISAENSTNSFAYAYDGIGNRISSTVSAPLRETLYTANSLNQYMAIAGGATNNPVYDADGNMLANGVWSYTWDAENRLIGVASNGTPVVTNAYDYLNRRVTKTTAATVTRFIWDGWNIAAQIDIDRQTGATNVTCYVWGLDLSGTMQGAGGVGGLLAVIRPSGTFYPCYDANGNATDYVNATGNVVAHDEFDIFGNIIAKSGTMADAFAFRFSTKYFDAETGLVMYQLRPYSPPLGRWLSKDPIEEQGGFNLYLFVGNSPINATDPLGLYTINNAWKNLISQGVAPATPGYFDPMTLQWIPGRYSDQQLFNEWVALEQADTGWLSNIPGCPDKICVANGQPQDCDHGQWKNFGAANQTFHPNASWCMRSNTSSGPGQQCCYDSQGDLITSGLGAGTPDRQAASFWNGLYLNHYLHDVAPFNIAWQLDGGILGSNLSAYLAVRPPSQGGGSCCK